MQHFSLSELEVGLDVIRKSPQDGGVLALIVRRPDVGAREVLEEAELDTGEGLRGDSWIRRAGFSSLSRSNAPPNPETQLNVMNARAIALIAGSAERWPLAGDQLFVDLDLSADNLPPGTRLALGEAIIEVTPVPHRGCKKFEARFGADAVKFVNSEEGKRLNLRGINAKVVCSGIVRIGDVVRKV